MSENRGGEDEGIGEQGTGQVCSLQEVPGRQAKLTSPIPGQPRALCQRGAAILLVTRQ